MQTHELQRIQPPIVEFGHSPQVDVFPIIERESFVMPISTGSFAQWTQTPWLDEHRLASRARRCAIELASLLEQLKASNEQVIYPIISILEPYMKATEELDLRMPPLSSRRVTINVTDRGRAKPDLYI